MEPTGPSVEVLELAHAPGRPSGRRFGLLVHATLAGIAIDADAERVRALVVSQARVVGASAEETAAAAGIVLDVLRQPLLIRAHAASRTGRCRRETPVVLREADGTLIEGVVDLAFEEDGAWTVVDFKTDAELAGAVEAYKRQVALYVRAITAATGMPARGILVSI
jgi:ATP-dependent exoDNAse (exonuclease V) beta subunit